MKMRHRNKAFFLIWIMIVQLLAPVHGFALSGGNKAPEFESFQPFGLDNMVDPATGDFSYNIPLMNVGFHGINLAYQAGITMDQEATMVGLGWNINSGMINRTVRGIPDDFRGDKIDKTMSTKPYVTIGYGAGAEAELFGFDRLQLEASFGVSINSYNGIGFDFGINPSVSLMKFGDSYLTGGFGIAASSDGGVNLSPNVSFKSKLNEENEKTKTSAFKIGSSINSRGGLVALSLSHTTQISEQVTINKTLKGSLSFAKPSFTPDISFPTRNVAFSAQIAAGPSFTGAFPEGKMNGYFSSQYIAEKNITVPGFGMMYIENVRDNGLQDFHHSKDIPQSEDVPNLAVPQLDYDTYSISGPGMMGSMTLNRGDLGFVHDRVQSLTSGDVDFGVELGPGAMGHIGGDITGNRSIQETKKWTSQNRLSNVLNFNNSKVNQSGFEKAFFNKVDDPSIELATGNDFYYQVVKKEPIRPTLSKYSGLDFQVNRKILEYDSGNESFDLASQQGKRNERVKRSNNISYKTFAEAKEYGFSKYLFGKSNFFEYKESMVEGSFSEAIDHHVAEIIVENADGYKYVYGLPLFNLSQSDEVFSVEYNAQAKLLANKTGLIPYENTVDNSEGNRNGIDHYYSKTTLPAYVSSYALTAILSSDYQDISGDGPSPDDYGDYVRFDYNQPEQFHWKTPTSEKNRSQPNEPQASLSIGFESKADINSHDDKGSIVYGLREQTSPMSISNKHEIAIYDYYPEQRKDGWGEHVDGTVDRSSVTHALRSITKYNLSDFATNRTAATTIKGVHFEYNYSLCPGIYNGDNGKLTLKKVYILNGESTKGRFSPYEFEYDFNPKYVPKAINRFSGYQPRIIGDTEDLDNYPIQYFAQRLTTVNFPYVPQSDRAMQDYFASAWNLNRIKMPSGGEIHVEYEADDYAYVQDKHAMQMYEIKGFSGSATSPSSSGTLNDYLHFEITDQAFLDRVTTQNGKQLMKDYLIRDIEDKWLYYKVYGTLKGPNSNVKEFVPGWAKIEEYGINLNSSGATGWIKLKKTCLNERKHLSCLDEINPIQKTLMQALRLNLPERLYGTEGTPSHNAAVSTIISSIRALTSVAEQMVQFVVGVNNYMKGLNYGTLIDPELSFIRLYTPSQNKISGGHRVKRLVMVDNFNQMTSGVHQNGIYGKQYEYKIEDTANTNYTTISSGVAAYEPIVGGEENPFYQPIDFKEELLFAPDNTKYMEEPMMEDYFPSPRIIYSRVMTKDIYSTSGEYEPDEMKFEDKFDGDLSVYAKTGFSESQYYTYKDFPITPISTDKMYGDPYQSPKVIEFLNVFAKDKYTAVQGYFLHDPVMHGKPKANYVYNASGQRISGQEQLYKTTGNALDENVRVLTKTDSGLSIVDGRMGLEYSLFGCAREMRSRMTTIGTGLQIDLTTPPPFPLPIPSGYPSFADIEKRFRSMVLVKTLRQHGVLHKTKAINGASEIVTEHLLWDAETAQPIVSKTTNEYEDPIYTVNLPAHLAYDQMGLTYQNEGAEFSGVTSTNGNVTNNSSFISSCQIGDKLAINGGSSTAWVLHKNPSSVYLIDEGGNPVSWSNASVKIIESGYTNQGSASIASYISLENPIVGNSLIIDESKRIIDASATTYKDHWQTFCGEQINISQYVKSGHNLVSDGSFESGDNEFFTTDYFEKYESRAISPSQYLISDNTADAQPAWDSCTTDFGSQMLIVDTNQHGQINIWCQEIDVNPNTGYELGLYLTSANIKDVDAQIRFTVNGEHIGDSFTAPNNNDSSTCNWGYFSNNYQTGEQSQVTLCIENVSIGGRGNDFAIDHITMIEMIKPTASRCNSASAGSITNPFLQNIKGNWRADRSYVFQTDRQSTNDIREDGSYFTDTKNYNQTFTDFWQQGSQGITSNLQGWTWTNENTMVSPIGLELEAKDPLERYSAELTGYNNIKVVAVAANARYNEIAYYGAEVPLSDGADVYGVNQPNRGGEIPSNNCRPQYHFKKVYGERVQYDRKNPNSGDYCLSFLSKLRKILKFETRPILSEACVDEQGEGPYEIQPCDCIPGFEPTEGKKYVVSAWLNHRCLQEDNCNESPYLQVKSGRNTFKIDTYGPLIEGWRKVEGTFEVAEGDHNGEISLEDFGQQIFLDDIRIHPYHASMKTYNYDLTTLRFTFEHDDNNYFTRYDYADDGTLQRISKQTERGVQTLQESTFGQQKIN